MVGRATEERERVRYQLDSEDVASATAELFRRFDQFVKHAREAGHQHVCVAIDGSDPLSNIGRNIEQRAFETLADNLPPETMLEEYGPYEDRSLFLIGLDLESEQAQAALRLIMGVSGVGPPTKSVRDAVLHDGYRSLREPDIDLTDSEPAPEHLTCGMIGSRGVPSIQLSRRQLEADLEMKPGELLFDIGTFARMPRVGSKEAGLIWTPLLAAASTRLAVQLGVKHTVTFVTVDLINMVRRLTGTPWKNLGMFGEVEYIDGDSFKSQPSYLNIQEMIRTLKHRRRTGVRRQIPEVSLERLLLEPANDSAFLF